MRNFNTSIKTALLFSALAASALMTMQSAWALDSAGEGRRSWLKYNCYGCHGMFAGGGMGPRVSRETGELAEAVLQGKGEGMPSYKLIVTQEDISNMVNYLDSIGTASEPKFMRWWEENPSE